MEIAQIARFRAAKKMPSDFIDTKTWTTYLAITICIKIKIFGRFIAEYDIHYVYILLLTLE